jgi:hypothetical protein
MLRTDLSSIESLRSVQILLYWFLASVLDRSGREDEEGQVNIRVQGNSAKPNRAKSSATVSLTVLDAVSITI